MIKKVYSIIHTKIYYFLLKHYFCDAIVAVFRKRRNQEFCKAVAGRSNMLFSCHCLGDKNKDKNIYVIRHGKPTSGFGVQLRELLKYLCYADRFGMYPVIIWNEVFPYSQRGGVNEVTNPYEYYFMQPTEVSVEEIAESYNVFFSEEIHISDFFVNHELENGEKGYWMSEEYIDMLARVMSKYIRLNKRTEKYIDEGIQSIFTGEKILGVHIRGTDYYKNYNNHPIPPSVSDYFLEIDLLLEQKDYERIFLATDDQNLLHDFCMKYDKKVVYFTDVARGNKKTSVVFSESKRENHNYLLGLEVLRDMYALAKCDALVAGISQVSLMTRIIKKSMFQEFECQVIIDKGYNKNKNNFVG